MLQHHYLFQISRQARREKLNHAGHCSRELSTPALYLEGSKFKFKLKTWDLDSGFP
jgi:hypothetical protein